MSDKSFLDTNVLIYCYTETEPSKRAIATAIAARSGSWIVLKCYKNHQIHLIGNLKFLGLI